jgi:hypothetical protein
MPAAAAYSMQDQYGAATRVIRVKGTSSYTTGGYDLPLSGTVSPGGLGAIALNHGSAVIGLVASGKVKFVTASTGAEVANASDQSANLVLVLIP